WLARARPRVDGSTTKAALQAAAIDFAATAGGSCWRRFPCASASGGGRRLRALVELFAHPVVAVAFQLESQLFVARLDDTARVHDMHVVRHYVVQQPLIVCD